MNLISPMQLLTALVQFMFFKAYFVALLSCSANEIEKMDSTDIDLQHHYVATEFFVHHDQQELIEKFLISYCSIGYLDENEMFVTCLIVLYDDFMNKNFPNLKKSTQIKPTSPNRFIFFEWFLSVISTICKTEEDDCLGDNITDLKTSEILSYLCLEFTDFLLIFRNMFLIKSYGSKINLDEIPGKKLHVFLLYKLNEIIFNKNSKMHGFVPEALASIAFFRNKTQKLPELNQKAIKKLIFILIFIGEILGVYEGFLHEFFFFGEIEFLLRFLFEEICILMKCYTNYKNKAVCLVLLREEIGAFNNNSDCYVKTLKKNICFFLNHVIFLQNESNDGASSENIVELKKYVLFLFEFFSIVTEIQHYYSNNNEDHRNFNVKYNTHDFWFSLSDEKNKTKIANLSKKLPESRQYIIDPKKNSSFRKDLVEYLNQQHLSHYSIYKQNF